MYAIRSYYVNPDVFVYKLENEFVILVNDDGMPRLHVNNFYKNAFKDGGTFSDDAKEYIQEKMRSATWLIRSIHQRQKTIYKVMESRITSYNVCYTKLLRNISQYHGFQVCDTLVKETSLKLQNTFHHFVYGFLAVITSYSIHYTKLYDPMNTKRMKSIVYWQI